MTDDLDQQEAEIRAGFEEAVALSDAKREEYLAAIDDEIVRERLRALLAADARPTANYLQAPHADGPSHIGDYELLRLLGRGGMGVVMLAYTEKPSPRLVAIKLIGGPGQDSDSLERFHAEQQALTRVDHPGIARILDSGETEDGTPYLAMEYVRGEPITRYCDRRRLPVEARCRLMIQSLEAIQHAHQKGILHRDLKPANILVTERDGKPTPKLIDFGLARAISGQLAEMRPTQPGAVLGTLLYMSPEQADPEGQDVDTRTDVFALGAVLHELLLGQPPIPLDRGEGALLRFHARLASGDAPGLAASAKAMPTEALAELAAHRSTSITALSRELSGDLSPIVSRATALDRVARYATASEFAADLHRYLAGEPVIARPATLAYLVTSFARRNKFMVTTVAAAILALLTGAAIAVNGLLEARRANAAAAQTNQRLEDLVARQRAVTEFSEFVQLYGDPGLEEQAPSLRQSLLGAAKLIQERWADQPRERAAVHKALGDALLVLGEPREGISHLRSAWQIAQLHANTDPTWAMAILASLSRAEREVHDLQASRLHLRQLLEFGAKSVAPANPRLASHLKAIGGALDSHENLEAAVANASDALNIMMQDVGAPALSRAERRLLGQVLFSTSLALHHDEVPGSGELLQRMEGVARDALDGDPEFAGTMLRMAENHLEMGQPRRALALANETLARLESFSLSQHWLNAQAQRVRGLALALGDDQASGERELVALREQLFDKSQTGNAQVRAAHSALSELCSRLAAANKLRPYLVASYSRWKAAIGADPNGPPWWATRGLLRDPVMLAQVLSLMEVDQAALPPARRDELLGAVLLRLGRRQAARERLEAALRAAPSASPELLADLVVAHRKTGDASGAKQIEERLIDGETRATGIAQQRWQRARAEARSH